MPGNKSVAWKVNKSGIHRRGVFAARDIPEGERVIEYVGDKVTKAESDRRAAVQLERAESNGDGAVYIFTLNKRYDIDGNVSCNKARLVNHSCDPNCETQIIRGHIWIIAIREIRKGDEITYNYNFDLDCYDEHPCNCGSRRCMGYIVGEEFRKKLKKKIAEARKKRQAGKKSRRNSPRTKKK